MKNFVRLGDNQMKIFLYLPKIFFSRLYKYLISLKRVKFIQRIIRNFMILFT
jgi:hypothetical protein